MKILWQHGELKPADIQAHFSETIKNPALRSYLTVLMDKGHVRRRLIGKAYHYKATTRSSATMKHSLKRIVDVFFDGSTEALMMNLIKSEKLSEKELLELKRISEGKSELTSDDKATKTARSTRENANKKNATNRLRKKRGKRS